MAWLFGSRAAAAGTPPAAVPAGHAAHRSVTFGALVSSLNPEARPQVLDLGPPLGGNIEWLSARSCRVFVVDLHRSLMAETLEARDREHFPQLVERLVPLTAEDRLDAVLAWDVFNYLRPDQLEALMARIAPACRPGAQVLSFIATRREIPATPLRYRILSPDTLSWEGAQTPTRAAAGYHQPDFARLMPRFRLKSSFLLRNGIQEYLFSARA
jgi:Methyltransferase domain